MSVNYRLRAITFSLQEAVYPGTTFSTIKTASVEKLDKPFVVVGASYKSFKSTNFDVTNIDFVSMGLTEYEAYRKFSLLPHSDDVNGRSANLLILFPDLSNFEASCAQIVLTGIVPTDYPVIHILEKI